MGAVKMAEETLMKLLTSLDLFTSHHSNSQVFYFYELPLFCGYLLLLSELHKNYLRHCSCLQSRSCDNDEQIVKESKQQLGNVSLSTHTHKSDTQGANPRQSFMEVRQNPDLTPVARREFVLRV